MSALLSIGDFARATYLTVKALRHYHETGLIEPADVDPGTGYRRYRSDQIPYAQLVRRLRELDVPIDQVKTILAADSQRSREVLRSHLDGMRLRLDETTGIVLALQTMLGEELDTQDVVWRQLAGTLVLAVQDEVAFDDGETWLNAAFKDLHTAVIALGCRVVGADGARWSNTLFTTGRGTAVAFVPVDAVSEGATPPGRVRLQTFSGGLAASTVHHGSFADIDLAYGRLASAVAQARRAVSGRVQENYLGADRCEVIWRVADHGGD